MVHPRYGLISFALSKVDAWLIIEEKESHNSQKGTLLDYLWLIYQTLWNINLKMRNVTSVRKIMQCGNHYAKPTLVYRQQNSYSISHLLGTVTTRWLESDSVVTVANYRQHADRAANDGIANALPVVSNGEFTVT